MGGCEPATGPDLGLFCFLGEVLGALRSGEPVHSTVPPGLWVAAIAALIVLGWSAARIVAWRARAAAAGLGASRRPRAYLQCPACRALSPEEHERCYSCGQSLAGATVRLPVATVAESNGPANKLPIHDEK